MESEHDKMRETPMKSWLEVLTASLSGPQFGPLGEQLPEFPTEELQRNTTGLSSEAALAVAFAFYQDVRDSLSLMGRPLTRESRVLDFGCGWGRISRVFMHDVPMDRIHGIDVDPDFVSLTRRSFKGGHFETCKPFPPTSFDEASFDLVFAFSVFSHLSEKAVQEWMAEFARILKPGGAVVFTTRHESFFDYCAWAGTLPPDGSYLSALGRLFPDIREAKARFKAGEIVHATSLAVSGGGPRDSSFYGETWIPESYARGRFGRDWEFIAQYFDAGKYDQVSFALRRRA